MSTDCIINVIGMPFGEHGLGQSMRDMVVGLGEAGGKVDVINVDYSSLKANGDKEIAHLVTEEARGDINLICLNATMFRLALRDKPELFANRYNILHPYWEFRQVPEKFEPPLQQANEIWAPGRFLAEVWSSVFRGEVREMPLHVRVGPPNGERNFRSELKIEPDEFVFMLSFDGNSCVPRKDPSAGILAFLEAFGNTPERKVRLLIKYVYRESPSLRIEDIRSIERLAAADPRITLLCGALSREDMLSLFSSIDAYVSPHRCEGLGRPIVEAMLFGKPVIATDYSGVADIVRPYIDPLPYTLAPVGRDAIGDIRAEYTWALCDVSALAAAMTKLESDRAFARALGLCAKTAMSELSSPRLFGEAALARCESIRNMGKGNHLPEDLVPTSALARSNTPSLGRVEKPLPSSSFLQSSAFPKDWRYPIIRAADLSRGDDTQALVFEPRQVSSARAIATRILAHMPFLRGILRGIRRQLLNLRQS